MPLVTGRRPGGRAAREFVVPTSRGPARATVHRPSGPNKPFAMAVLLHGAGTDTARSPLPELANMLADLGLAAVRFDQPGRVAGRRAPDPAAVLDRVLLEALPQMRDHARRGAPLVLIGRSSGARVACRTAVAAGAAAVVALGFPFRPPARAPRPLGQPDTGRLPVGNRADPAEIRAAELRTAFPVPVLILQGERDPFGVPAGAPGLLIEVFADTAHTPTLAMAVRASSWISTTLGIAPPVAAF